MVHTHRVQLHIVQFKVENKQVRIYMLGLLLG